MSSVPPSAVTFPASAPELIYVGWWIDHSTSWAGSAFKFFFTGRYAYLALSSERKDADNGGAHTVCWTVNGGEVHSSDVVDGVPVLIFENATDGEEMRTVEVKLADWASTLTIEGVILESDSSLHHSPLAQTQKQPLRILFIGDSITCGWTSGVVPFPHGVSHAYPSVVERHLRPQRDTDVQIVAYPGIRLVGDEGDLGIQRGMKNAFWSASPWSNELTPSFTSNPPSIIFINLGTNDYRLGISEEKFISSMRSFMERLRETFTLEHIVVISPFGEANPSAIATRICEPALTNLCDQMRREWDAAEAGQSSTTPKLHHLDTTGWLTEQMVMDDVHPTLEGHEVLGQKVVQWIKEHGLV